MLQASPPFFLVSMDVARPYIIRLAHNYKATTKVWVLIYLCNITKSLHLELVENYSSPALVSTLKQVLAIHNTPSQITMNPGRNFVQARTLITEPHKDGGLSSNLRAEAQDTYP